MAKRKKPLLPIRAILILIGVLALNVFGVVYVVSMSSSGSARSRIFCTDPTLIQEIVLRPAAAPYQTPLSRAVTISLPDQILKSSALLRQSARFHPDHPATRWQCHIEVVTAEGSTFGTICQTENQGVILYVHCDRVGGWMYGKYRNDALAEWVKTVAAASGTSQGTLTGSAEINPDE